MIVARALLVVATLPLRLVIWLVMVAAWAVSIGLDLRDVYGMRMDDAATFPRLWGRRRA